MTVDATHVALLDFREDPQPAFARDQSADLGDLLASVAMIELEHKRICNSAVNAGMRREVEEHVSAI
jgi:hypothetical protein